MVELCKHGKDAVDYADDNRPLQNNIGRGTGPSFVYEVVLERRESLGFCLILVFFRVLRMVNF